MSVADRIEQLDGSLLAYIESQTSEQDRASLLALHAAVAQLGDFRYLEIGSYLGGTLQGVIADPRCTRVTSIDRRDRETPDERPERITYPGNTTSRMVEALATVPHADLTKLVTVDG